MQEAQAEKEHEAKARFLGVLQVQPSSVVPKGPPFTPKAAPCLLALRLLRETPALWRVAASLCGPPRPPEWLQTCPQLPSLMW